MLLEINDFYGCCRYSFRYLRLPVKCEECSEEMHQVSQGLTDYQWYKDYYCPTCKRTIVKLDKDQNTNGNKITERNF